MENKYYDILHQYQPDKRKKFEKVDILVYQDSILFTGYTKIGEAMSSFLHLQFHDLMLDGIYSTQLQMVDEKLIKQYNKSDILNVFHCESDFVLVPTTELEKMSRFDVFNSQYSDPAEKLLSEDFDGGNVKELYNYPYRVYNDLDFAFPSGKFYSAHRPIFDELKARSIGRNLIYISVKTKNIEIISFNDGALKLCNSFKIESGKDNSEIIYKALKKMKIDPNSEDIYVTCIQKEQKDFIFDDLRTKMENFNYDVEEAFGFPKDFWEVYGDLILCS